MLIFSEDTMKPARRFFVPVAVFAAVLMLGACGKKPVKSAPPPPPSPPAGPSASLSANPNSVNKGDATTLTWETTNANDVQIDGIGPVNPSGSRQVTPTDSITYRLVAKGAGGTQEAAKKQETGEIACAWR